ncbi:MAG: DnaJ family domain-containing protein [Planctomycetota bacterium]
MEPFERIVEERLQRAERDGVFRGLPGSGRPLELEDVTAVPDELRTSYLLLKSNGFVPPELEARKEWLRLQDLLDACVDADERAQLDSEVTAARQRYEQQIAARAPRLAALRAARGGGA